MFRELTRIKSVLLVVAVFVFITGCVATKDYTKFNNAKPASILVVPVVNRSVEVSASDYFLSTITIPIAEKGYYVFPVYMVKRVLEDDGLSDADLVHNAPTQKLSEIFGSDAVLYINIEKWEAKYMLLTTQVTVDLSYVLKDGDTGEELWAERQTMVYVPQNQSTGNPLADLLVMAVNAAVTKAAPNYMPLAKQANNNAFAYPGPGIPSGPYYVKPKPGTTHQN
ncbi:MAG TPA: GNA1162 family protein [Dehalococcoidia bacterium]